MTCAVTRIYASLDEEFFVWWRAASAESGFDTKPFNNRIIFQQAKQVITLAEHMTRYFVGLMRHT